MQMQNTDLYEDKNKNESRQQNNNEYRSSPPVVYLQLEDKVQITAGGVKVKDVARLYTHTLRLKEEIKEITIYEFEKKETRQIISMLWITKIIREKVPECFIVPMGETDCVVERLNPKMKDGKGRGWQNLKILLISITCMFGGAFSVMSFHNDIAITDMFKNLYEFVTGEASNGCTILELSYSIGLLVGILVFYNHVGKRRITADPTPVEVSMRTYEMDMNEAMVKSWEREGKKIDVD